MNAPNPHHIAGLRLALAETDAVSDSISGAELESLIAQASAAPKQGEIHQYRTSSFISWIDTDAAGLESAVAQGFETRTVYGQTVADEVNGLRNALADIAKKASQSRSVTRRLTWIEGRAQSALEGKDWARHVFMMADPRNGKPRAERLAITVATLRGDLAERDRLIFGVLGASGKKRAEYLAKLETLVSATAKPADGVSDGQVDDQE